jgi:hypothetical protein
MPLRTESIIKPIKVERESYMSYLYVESGPTTVMLYGCIVNWLYSVDFVSNNTSSKTVVFPANASVEQVNV